jgi:hypothetical protein
VIVQAGIRISLPCENKKDKAEKILGNAITLHLSVGTAIPVMIFMDDILRCSEVQRTTA